jgi:electron transport complex protein RnfG
MVVTLFVVAVTCAVVLSFVYAFTEPRIEETKIQMTLSGLAEVISAHEFVEVTPGTLWQALDSAGNDVGIVFRVFPQGYGGPIPITVGLNNEAIITGIRVASAAEGLSETPGLGAKITEPSFTDQFKDKCAAEVSLEQDGGAIQAITAATISSRAVSDGVRKGIETYAGNLGVPFDMNCVFAEADNFVEVLPGSLWYALGGSDTLGIVFFGAAEGYLDAIKFAVGYSRDQSITGVTIVYSQETEGIGEVIRDEEFLEQFKQGIPDAISGATVSSKALIDGVRTGIERFKEYVE